MGTSMSGKGQGGNNPLIPLWAEDSPPVKISSPDGSVESDVSNGDIKESNAGSLNADPSSNRFTGARRAFGEYAKSGNRDDLKRSLGHYSRSSTGGGGGVARRLASGITAGAGLIGLLSGGQVSTSQGKINLSDLSGLTTDQAIDKIIEVITPNNADADSVRSAMNFAMSEVLEDFEDFSDAVFTPEILGQVLTCYLTDLIFEQVVLDMGKAWFHAETPLRQITMESDLRELIKVIVDSKLSKNDCAALNNLTAKASADLQVSIIKETIAEWESFQ